MKRKNQCGAGMPATLRLRPPSKGGVRAGSGVQPIAPSRRHPCTRSLLPLDLARLWNDPSVFVLFMIGVFILPVAAMLGGSLWWANRMMRRAPFPPPVVPDLPCPFCGHGMRHGRIAFNGYPSWWEPDGAPRPRVWVA